MQLTAVSLTEDWAIRNIYLIEKTLFMFDRYGVVIIFAIMYNEQLKTE